MRQLVPECGKAGRVGGGNQNGAIAPRPGDRTVPQPEIGRHPAAQASVGWLCGQIDLECVELAGKGAQDHLFPRPAFGHQNLAQSRVQPQLHSQRADQLALGDLSGLDQKLPQPRRAREPRRGWLLERDGLEVWRTHPADPLLDHRRLRQIRLTAG